MRIRKDCVVAIEYTIHDQEGTVVDTSECSQQKNGCFHTSTSNGFHHGQAIEGRQHAIDNHQVVFFSGRQKQPVAAVAGNYLTLRGLDEQLSIARRTLGAYGESVRLYTLQFQYGQVSQLQVAQVQSQYETAAVQIPLLESIAAVQRQATVHAIKGFFTK